MCISLSSGQESSGWRSWRLTWSALPLWAVTSSWWTSLVSLHPLKTWVHWHCRCVLPSGLNLNIYIAARSTTQAMWTSIICPVLYLRCGGTRLSIWGWPMRMKSIVTQKTLATPGPCLTPLDRSSLYPSLMFTNRPLYFPATSWIMTPTLLLQE